MKGGFIILAVCVFASAMVARDERDGGETTTSDAPSTTAVVNFCAPQTPCAWLVYNKVSKREEYKITNSYCICSSNLTCVINEDDTVAYTYVMRCRVPSNDSNEEEEPDFS